MRSGWIYEGFISIFNELLGYAYSSGFKPSSIKSSFEPLTLPLKWVLADAACKVSMIFFNIASIRAGRCTMVQSVSFLYEFLDFRDFE